MDRSILHADCNCFYAAVEMLHHPEYAGQPLAVGGDPEKRHGIVLTANYIAKRCGVKTGMALWQARQACPSVIFLPPRMDLYLRFSRLVNEIYADYTDLREPFGIDETWLDVTDCLRCSGDALSVAEEISARVKKELGITVSVGISWNKIFAKFGSDYKKPDAITEITRENYRQMVWTAPAADLLYVGRATKAKLSRYGLRTIGDLATCDPLFLKRLLGKMGLVLSLFARGEDETPVSAETEAVPLKSVGNSTTTPRDLTTEEDVRIVLYLLSESVAARLKENGFAGKVIGISLRDNGLFTFTRQHKITVPTNVSEEIAQQALSLFRAHYDWSHPLRSVGVRVSELVPEGVPYQLNLFADERERERQRRADGAVTEIRRRFGFFAVQRGLMFFDKQLSALDAKAEDHMVHPHSYMERGNRTGVREEEEDVF
ncbi:MAG: DNA polymerase IV [Lachnospiraceae bacterium]|nr:DNA polymerase IV [Lachnospiraceae bacterium]